MSLDLYIISPEPVKKKTTGVFYRKDGKTVECETVEQVKDAFPGRDISDIDVIEYETDEYWHGNLTHNLTRMAAQVKADGYTLYDLMWHPDDHGFVDVTTEYVDLVNKMIPILDDLDQEVIDRTTPDNGWGTYEQLRDVAGEFAARLKDLAVVNNHEDYKIVADT